MTKSENSNLASFDRVIDEFLDRLRAGDSPNLEDYIQRYPENASEIREVFPALLLAEQIKQESTNGSRNLKSPSPGRKIENDLLLGMLALQYGLIKREQFLESFAKWNSDRSRSYRSVLLSEKLLNKEAIELLELLAVKPQTGNMSQSVGHDLGAKAWEFTIDLGGQPDQPLSNPLSAKPASEPASYKRSEMIGNYKLLQKIAEGGMGDRKSVV